MGLEMTPLYWLIIFVILLVMELQTMGLTTIWFAGGALVAMVLCLLGLGFWPQMIAFVAVSALLLIFTRPFAVKYINRDHVSTNVDELIGKEAIVLEDIENLQSRGRVQVNGMEWTARSAEPDRCIAKGETVEICRIEGVKLIVKEKEKAI